MSCLQLGNSFSKDKDMQLKGKLIEFCSCDSSELCIQPSADTHRGNWRTLTKTDEKPISQQPICFSIMLILWTQSNLGVFNQQ